jgi:hypothetical protein
MNRKKLSKAFGVLGLMAALSTAIGVAVQQTVQAQLTVEVPTDVDEEACIAAGFYTFDLVQNIDLSPAQLEELYKVASAEADAFESLIDSFPKEKDFNSLQTVTKPGANISPDVMEAIDAASLALSMPGAATAETVAAFNEEFGQYVEMLVGSTVIYTEAQKAEIQRLQDDFEAQSLAVLTPEQQQQYQENLETESRINEVCGIVKQELPTTGTTTF